MLAALGAEVLSLIAKEIIKHGPDIQEAIMKEIEHISSVLWKHTTEVINKEVDELEKK